MIRLQLSNRTKNNRSDKSANCDRPALALPCPADSLIGLVLVLGSPASENDGRLHSVLRLNPSLLLFALDQFQLANRKIAESATDLVQWCKSNLLECLKSQPLAGDNRSIAEPQKTKNRLADFLRVRSQSKCRKSLNRWLKYHTLLTKAERKTLLKTLLAKSFRLDGFQAKRVRRQSTLKNEWTSWNAKSQVETKLRPLVELVFNHSLLQADFSRCVETEKLAAMKQLAYGASHEINNPLANVATRAQTLLVDEAHPERRNKLATIYQQAMRAHEMISDMMLFAHPPATKIELQPIRQFLRPFIYQLERSSSQDDEIQIRFAIGPNIQQVWLDTTQILVVVDSMIQNAKEAIRANDAEGQIELRFGLVDGHDEQLPTSIREQGAAEWLQVSIWDNGAGIDRRVRQHLFDPFFSGREAGRGLGFGLSKSWRIVEQHGGELRLDENCERGTRFVFWLPQPASVRRANKSAAEINVENKVRELAENVA